MAAMDCRDENYLDEFFTENTDAELRTVAYKLRSLVDDFTGYCARVARQSVDEVIDMPRTGRFSLDQAEKTEKTYIGTKVEILFRHGLGLPYGNTLDLLVDGIEVDVKNTVRSNWSIPSEAINQICFLLQINDEKSWFSAGLLRCSLGVLNQGRNKDGKGTVSVEGKKQILWFAFKAPLPENFYLQMDAEKRSHILEGNSANERLYRLFTTFRGVPIHRHVVLATVQDNAKDPMKRLRRNGGARDKLEAEGFRLLSAKYDKDEIVARGISAPGTDNYYCFET